MRRAIGHRREDKGGKEWGEEAGYRARFQNIIKRVEAPDSNIIGLGFVYGVRFHFSRHLKEFTLFFIANYSVNSGLFCKVNSDLKYTIYILNIQNLRTKYSQCKIECRVGVTLLLRQMLPTITCGWLEMVYQHLGRSLDSE